MVPFADGFWEIKNLNDTIAVFGFLLTMFSIWLTWWLAKRDLSKRIEEAERSAVDVVERIATALIQSELGEVVRCLRDARDAVRHRDWKRALLRFDDAEHYLVRVQDNPRLRETDAEFFRRATDDLTVLSRQVAALDKAPGGKDLSAPKRDILDQLIRGCALIDSRLRGRLLEDGHVRTDDRPPPPPPVSDGGAES